MSPAVAARGRICLPAVCGVVAWRETTLDRPAPQLIGRGGAGHARSLHQANTRQSTTQQATLLAARRSDALFLRLCRGVPLAMSCFAPTAHCIAFLGQSGGGWPTTAARGTTSGKCTASRAPAVLMPNESGAPASARERHMTKVEPSTAKSCFIMPARDSMAPCLFEFPAGASDPPSPTPGPPRVHAKQRHVVVRSAPDWLAEAKPWSPPRNWTAPLRPPEKFGVHRDQGNRETRAGGSTFKGCTRYLEGRASAPLGDGTGDATLAPRGTQESCSGDVR